MQTYHSMVLILEDQQISRNQKRALALLSLDLSLRTDCQMGLIEPLWLEH